MSDSSERSVPASGAPEPIPPRAARRRRRPSADALEVAGAGWFWGGWLGLLWELMPFRRVLRRIRESRARRGARVREAAAARRGR